MQVTLATTHKRLATITRINNRLSFDFRYDLGIKDHIKAQSGARFDWTSNMWSFDITPHNMFQLAYLLRLNPPDPNSELPLGFNPYALWESPTLGLTYERPLYSHQKAMVEHGIAHHYVVFACEMGTGKTLSAIEMMERIEGECWYVGPKAGVYAVTRELNKWKSKVRPRMLTYEGMKKVLSQWDGSKAPRMLIFDEFHKIKNETAQRSKAARHLADAIRREYGQDGFIIGMSGTPAPKSPLDWWWPCEVIAPGFLREGTKGKFKRRLAFTEKREGLYGAYEHLLSWRDDEEKCEVCGQYWEEAIEHHVPEVPDYHIFKHSTNEVAGLFERMKGLVLVQFKKDCIQLPEMTYEVIKAKPTVDMLRAMQTIINTSTRAITALSRCRQLSDGFQYVKEKEGDEICAACDGKGKGIHPIATDTEGPNTDTVYEFEEGPCAECNGTGKQPIIVRNVKDVTSPKDEYLMGEVEKHEEIGRLVIWAGFQASIERITQLLVAKDWAVLRLDGRGYIPYNTDASVETLMNEMDWSTNPGTIEKLCIVANPQAGGTANTFTASPTAIYFSNTFDADARQQSEPRIHRMGMDPNRGARIVDIFCLPTDVLIYDNIHLKKKLQGMSMGQLKEQLWTSKQK